MTNIVNTKYLEHVTSSLLDLTKKRNEMEVNFNRSNRREYDQICELQIKDTIELLKLGIEYEDDENTVMLLLSDKDVVTIEKRELMEVMGAEQFNLFFPTKEIGEVEDKPMDDNYIFKNSSASQQITNPFLAMFTPLMMQMSQMVSNNMYGFEGATYNPRGADIKALKDKIVTLTKEKEDSERELELIKDSLAQVKQEALLHENEVTDSCNKKMKEYEKKIEEIQKNNVSLESQIEDLKKLVEQADKEIKKLRFTIVEKTDFAQNLEEQLRSAESELELRKAEQKEAEGLRVENLQLKKDIADMTIENKEMSDFTEELINENYLYRDDINSLKAKINTIESKKEDMSKEISNLNTELDRKNSEMVTAYNKNEELKKELSEMECKLKQLEEESVSISKNYWDKQLQYEKLEVQLREKSSQLSNSESENHETKSQLASIMVQLETTQSQLQEARNQIDTSNSLYSDMQSQYDEAKAKLSDTQSELKTSMSQLNEMRLQYETTSSHLHETQSKLDATNTQLSSTKSQLDSTKSQLSSMQSQLDITKSQLNNTRSQLEVAKSQLSDAQSQLKTANERNSTLQNQFTGKDDYINKVKTEKKNLEGELHSLKTEVLKEKSLLENENNILKATIEKLKKEKEDLLLLVDNTDKEVETLKEENSTLFDIAYKDDKFEIGNEASFNRRLSNLSDDIQTIAMIDVCDMTNLNREYGEDGGDKAIRATINLLSSVFNKDNIYRTRGAQFGIVSEIPLTQMVANLKGIVKMADTDYDIKLVYGTESVKTASPREARSLAETQMKKVLKRLLERNDEKENLSVGSEAVNPNIASSVLDYENDEEDTCMVEEDMTQYDFANQILKGIK